MSFQENLCNTSLQQFSSYSNAFPTVDRDMPADPKTITKMKIKQLKPELWPKTFVSVRVYLKREFSTESLYNTSRLQFIYDSNAFPNVDRDRPADTKATIKL